MERYLQSISLRYVIRKNRDNFAAKNYSISLYILQMFFEFDICSQDDMEQRFPASGRCWSSRRARDPFIYFERNMGKRQNIYFGRPFAWLYLLIL